MRQKIIDILGNCLNSNCICSPKNESFIELNVKELYIFDDAKDDIKSPIKLVEKDNLFQIKITNTSNNPFVVVKNDACLVSKDIKKCDVLLYNTNEFYFLEIKDRKVKSKAKARKTAYEQLLSSIIQLKGLDFGSRLKYAVVGFSKPKTKIISTGSNSKKAFFKDNYNVKLMEGQNIVL